MLKKYLEIYTYSTMTLQDIEDGTGLHKSTISRIFSYTKDERHRMARKPTKAQIIALHHYFSKYLVKDFDI